MIALQQQEVSGCESLRGGRCGCVLATAVLLRTSHRYSSGHEGWNSSKHVIPNWLNFTMSCFSTSVRKQKDHAIQKWVYKRSIL